MNSWLRAIRVGDRCRIGETEYVVAGTAACLEPDNGFWTEWLLVPVGTDTAAAARARSLRWLGWEPDIGALLWTPIAVPEGMSIATLPGLHRLQHRGQIYRRMDADDFRLAHIAGDLGDAHGGERFDYVEFLAGSARLTAEWNGRGLEVFEGGKVTPVQVREWFLKGGVRLEARAAHAEASVVVRDPSPEAMARSFRREGSDFLGYTVVFGVFLLFLVLESCSQRCTTPRYNVYTGQTQYACPDGSVRNSSGWHGK